MKFSKTWFVTFLVLTAAVASASTSTPGSSVKQKLIDTMDTVRAKFHDRYALFEWKEELFSWSIDREISRLIRENTKSSGLTERRAQEIVSEFFQTTRDYHAAVYNSAPGRYTMDIRVRSAEGRAFIASVAAGSGLPLEKGDEVLRWDGVPIMDAIYRLKNLKYPVYDGFDQREADTILTTGYEMLLNVMPTSPAAQVEVRRKSTGETVTVSVPWKITKGTEAEVKQKLLSAPGKVSPLLLGRAETNRRFEEIKDATKAVSTGNFPKPQTLLWEATETSVFAAWIADVNGKKVGLIRIPSFSLSSAAAHSAAVVEFEGLVAKMRDEADVLLLDLLGNPGGMLDYAWALASYFFSTPVETFKFSYRLSPDLIQAGREGAQELAAITTLEEAYEFFGGRDYFGFPVDMDFVREVHSFYQGIADDGAAGLKLGQPRYYNAARIKPNPRVTYAKPLYVLTDEGSISCGDMFPALLQDTGRAKIIGRRTAGAGAFTGGSVQAENPLGMKYMVIPLALGYRHGGVKIENVGVKPDFEIPLTARELESGFQTFQEEVFRIVSAR